MTAVNAAAVSVPRVARAAAEPHHEADEAAASRPRGDAADAADLPREAANPSRPRTPRDDARAAATPGRRQPRGDVETGPGFATGRRLEQGADRIDRMYDRLVEQLDEIRRAVRAGDDASAYAAFGRAHRLFGSIVDLANELTGNLVSTGDAADDAARARIGETLRNAYTIAGVIEEEMPGDQTI